MGSVGRLSGHCGETVMSVRRGCLDCVEKLFGWCGEDTWKV